MVVLYIFFFFVCVVEVVVFECVLIVVVSLVVFGVIVVLMVFCYWVILSFGDCWNMCVLVELGVFVVWCGFYCFFWYLNYVVVVFEIVVFFLVYGVWLMVFVFSVVNVFLFKVCIVVEEDVLCEYCDYDGVFGVGLEG